MVRMNRVIQCICVMILCGACQSSKDPSLNSVDKIAPAEETQILAAVLSSYLKKVSPHREVNDWTYVINLSPGRIEELLATKKLPSGIKLISQSKLPRNQGFNGFSRITIEMPIRKSKSKCEVMIDEAWASLAAATWNYSCIKLGKSWYIAGHRLFCLA